MLELTRKGDYAVRGMLYLARQPKGSVSLLTDIAREALAPKTFLAKIMQSLAKTGLVNSTRGAGGGFVIARSAEQITLLDVVEAIDGPIIPNRCVIDDERCVFKDSCKVHLVWVEMQRTIRDRLQSVTLKELL